MSSSSSCSLLGSPQWTICLPVHLSAELYQKPTAFRCFCLKQNKNSFHVWRSTSCCDLWFQPIRAQYSAFKTRAGCCSSSCCLSGAAEGEVTSSEIRAFPTFPDSLPPHGLKQLEDLIPQLRSEKLAEGKKRSAEWQGGWERRNGSIPQLTHQHFQLRLPTIPGGKQTSCFTSFYLFINIYVAW